MAREQILKLLREKKEKIVKNWADAMQASSPRYADMPIEELEADASEYVDGVIKALETRDYSELFELLGRVARSRSSTGFKFSEVERALMRGTEILFDELYGMLGNGAGQEAFEAAKKFLRVTDMAYLSLGDSYIDIMEKEYSAATITAMSAAQEELNDKEISRRSLESACKMLGFDYGALVLRYQPGAAAEYPPGFKADAAFFDAVAGEVFDSGKIVSRDTELKRTNGIVVPAMSPQKFRSVAGIPIRARGKIIGAIVLASPVHKILTQHEKDFSTAIANQIGLYYENAKILKEARHRADYFKSGYDELMTILSQIGAVVYVADMTTYEIITTNKIVEDMFGRDLLGNKCYERLQKDQTGPCSFCTNRFLVKDGISTGPYTWKVRNTFTGQWFLCTDKAIEWTDGRLVRLEVAFDISEMENARSNLEDARQMVELYNDLLVHDIHNYVGVARTYLEFIANEPAPSDKHDEMVRTVIGQLDRISGLVDKVSKMSKAHASGQTLMDDRDLAAVLDEAVHEVRTAHGFGHVEIHTDYKRGVHFVKLGEFGKDIFLNLLTNAAKYGGGRPVEVMISEGDLDGKPAWKVSVIDEGRGISPEKRNQVFRRFERLDSLSKIKGLGLGLMLVRSLTEIYGGEVLVEDRVEGDYAKGTKFSILFPKVKKTA